MKNIWFLIMIILLPVIGSAQTVEGVVFEKNGNGKDPLPGVNVYWQGTNEGVVSGPEGRFEISKDNGQHMLVFSFVGYNSKVVHVNESGQLEVILEPNLAIEEVTVVNKNRGTYLSAINPIQTENINGAELHKAACCNLAESFETNPSVDVSYSDAVTGAKQIRLLGLEGTYSLLQVENMPNLRGLATNYGLLYVPGPWMESIQVSKGAASVLNGYESIAGQINVELKKPDADEKLYLNLFGSVDGRREINANTNIRLMDKKLTTGILVHGSMLDNRIDHNNDGFLDDPLSRQLQVFNRWKFNNGKGWMAQAGAGVLSDRRLGGQTDAQWDMQPVITNPYGVNLDNNRIEGFFKTGYVFPNQRTAVAWLSNFAQHDTRSFYGLTRYHADETRFYGSAVLTRDLDAAGVHQLNSGVSILYDQFNENLYDTDLEHTEEVPGIFAEYTLKPSPRFTLMAGLRTDFHNIFGTFVTPRMHFKYNLTGNITMRGSAGKGYRTAHVISENSYLLASGRSLIFDNDVMQEEAWNYGLTLVQNYVLWGRDLQLNAEYFRTDFQSQLIIDRETSASNVILAPLDGQSYANSIQFDLRYQPIERLDMLIAYRINDVKQTIGGELREKPLTSRYKGLINFNYTTHLKKWMFDYTVQFNGGGRIPRHPGELAANPNAGSDFYEFSPYTVMNAQVTKYFRHGSIYLGSENLTDFMQMNPVSGTENPYGPGFDATNVWGPVMGRRIYAGIRFNLDYE